MLIFYLFNAHFGVLHAEGLFCEGVGRFSHHHTFAHELTFVGHFSAVEIRTKAIVNETTNFIFKNKLDYFTGQVYDVT